MITEATATARANDENRREIALWSGEGDRQGQNALKWLPAWDPQEVDLAKVTQSLRVAYTPSNYRFSPSASKPILLYAQGRSAIEHEITSDTFYAFAYPIGIVFRSAEKVFRFSTVRSPSEAFAAVHFLPDAEVVVAPAGASLNIGWQLESLKKLKNGWAEGMQPADRWGEGYGKVPSTCGLDWLAEQFVAHYSSDLPRPYIYPTPEGGVQAEWSLGPNEVSLEVNLTDHSAEWDCLNLSTKDTSEYTLDLNSLTAWEWLGRELRRLRSQVE